MPTSPPMLVLQQPTLHPPTVPPPHHRKSSSPTLDATTTKSSLLRPLAQPHPKATATAESRTEETFHMLGSAYKNRQRRPYAASDFSSSASTNNVILITPTPTTTRSVEFEWVGKSMKWWRSGWAMEVVAKIRVLNGSVTHFKILMNSDWFKKIIVSFWH